MQLKRGYIYQIKNRKTNKSYIGFTINFYNRMRDHIYGASNIDNKFYNAIRKYGIENFEVRILEQPFVNELSEKEKYWIDFFDSFKNGYNSTIGGDGGPFRQGLKSSPDTCKKISIALKGKKSNFPAWNKGKTSWSKGKHFSVSHKNKLRKAHIGKNNYNTRKDITVKDVLKLRKNGLSYFLISQQLNCSVQVVVNRIKYSERYI